MKKVKLLFYFFIIIVHSFADNPNKIAVDSINYMEDIYVEGIDMDYIKEFDYVPDEKTAVKIAQAIWLPIYGKSIYKEKPFKATLHEDIWIVTGTLPKRRVGGTVYIEIRKSDCKVLIATHQK